MGIPTCAELKFYTLRGSSLLLYPAGCLTPAVWAPARASRALAAQDLHPHPPTPKSGLRPDFWPSARFQFFEKINFLVKKRVFWWNPAFGRISRISNVLGKKNSFPKIKSEISEIWFFCQKKSYFTPPQEIFYFGQKNGQRRPPAARADFRRKNRASSSFILHPSSSSSN